MKTVVQLDHQGYYVGTTHADQSPLEPGVYLMPAGTVDVAAPVVPQGKCARWVNHRWTFESLPEQTVNASPRDDEIESLKRQVGILQDQVSALRNQLFKISELKEQIAELSNGLDARI